MMLAIPLEITGLEGNSVKIVDLMSVTGVTYKAGTPLQAIT